MARIHTKKDAEFLMFLLKKLGFETRLIGGFGKGKETSEHDIDILITGFPSFTKRNFAKCMSKILEAEFYEYTDMKSWYFHNTYFGDVDVFFSTNHFDY